MNSRTASVLHALPRPLRAWLLVLALAFAGAQLHGLTHGISHLSRGHAVPHALLCADCVASAGAGAAPPPVIATPLIAPLTVRFGQASAAPLRAARPRAAYRSRAPPPTLT